MLLLAGCATTPRPLPSVAVTTAGRLGAPALDETSGLAISRRTPGLLWAHNDSGAAPLLHALDLTGRPRGTVRLAGASALDWEDLASFTLDGRAWLLVADVGDNFALRQDCSLYLIEEPSAAELRPDREVLAPVVARIPVRYPDGPRDCEAVAVDVARREILLISKRTRRPVIYRLPLAFDAASAARTPEATAAGALDGLPQPGPLRALSPRPDGRLAAWPTAFDLSADGRRAVLLTYGDVWLYSKTGDESWATALAGEPARLSAHGLQQAEAAALAADGSEVYVTSEGAHAPLLRYRLPD